MKKFKAFTLIELIIVMAIMSILMLAIMQMMKPIRATFVDTTYYEAQRTTQSGMVEYISENLRYANNAGIYTKGQTANSKTVNNVTDAITYFKEEVKNPDGSELSDSQIHVITIDNTTAYTYGNKTCYGRIVRSKPPASGTDYSVNAEKPNTTEGRLALGSPYYGENNYSINVVNDGTNIKMTVSSIIATSLPAQNAANAVKTEDITSNVKHVFTEGYIVCQNLPLAGNKFCTDYAGTSTTKQGYNTYIVYTLPETK